MLPSMVENSPQVKTSGIEDKDLADWMSILWNDIHDKNVRTIKLPGTHDSGIYSDVNTNPVRDQVYSLGNQLRLGIRSLDVRIMPYARGCGYTMHHAGLYPLSNNSQDFENAMNEVAAFVDNHPKECVFIKLEIDDSNNKELESSDLNADWNKILSRAFKTRIFPKCDLKEVTLDKMVSVNKRVFIIVENKKLNHEYFHKGDSLVSSWVGGQQKPSDNLDAQAKIIRSAAEEAFLARKYDSTPGAKEKEVSCQYNRFLQADLYGYSIGDNHERAQRLHSLISKWVEWWSNDHQFWEAINIVAIDFAGETGTAMCIVRQIINLNIREPQKTFVCYKPVLTVSDLYHVLGGIRIIPNGTQQSLYISKDNGRDPYLLSHYAPIMDCPDLFALIHNVDETGMTGVELEDSNHYMPYVSHDPAGNDRMVLAHKFHEQRNVFAFRSGITPGAFFMYWHGDSQCLFVSSDTYFGTDDHKVEAHPFPDERSKFRVYAEEIVGSVKRGVKNISDIADKNVILTSWKNDRLYRLIGNPGVAAHKFYRNSIWRIEVVNESKNLIRLKSIVGDYLHRPDIIQGVTTWGKIVDSNNWAVEFNNGSIRLKSWKNDYLHRPDDSSTVTTWNAGALDWYVDILST